MALVSNGDEIKLANNLFMDSPVIHFVMFIYHDTIFQAEINNKKSTYYYVKCSEKVKNSLMDIFKSYHKTSLDSQLKEIKYSYNNGCGPEGYFAFKTNETANFGLFRYGDYIDWMSRHCRKAKNIPLDSRKFPKIYSEIYHTLNSKQWDYFMSNNYYYKDLRTYQQMEYLEQN